MQCSLNSKRRYFCEKCNKLQDASRSIGLLELPEVTLAENFILCSALIPDGFFFLVVLLILLPGLKFTVDAFRFRYQVWS